MYRSVITLSAVALLAATVFAINPQARNAATDLWMESRPTLIAWKDRALNVLQAFLGGPDSRIDPRPVSPDINIEVIVAFDHDVTV